MLDEDGNIDEVEPHENHIMCWKSGSVLFLILASRFLIKAFIGLFKSLNFMLASSTAITEDLAKYSPLSQIMNQHIDWPI